MFNVNNLEISIANLESREPPTVFLFLFFHFQFFLFIFLFLNLGILILRKIKRNFSPWITVSLILTFIIFLIQTFGRLNDLTFDRQEFILCAWRLLLCVTLSKQRECWKLRDSRLSSEVDSRVHGQPSNIL